MTKVFVYDHVRTPRGRGKKDGALHEVPSVRLAAKVLEAVRDRNGLDTSTVDDVIMGCVDPVMDAGAVIPKAAAFEAGYSTRAPGMQISRFAPPASTGQFRRCEDRPRSGRHRDRRRRRVDVPRRPGHVGRRLVHGPLGQPARLFHAAGRFGRPDRHEIRFLARRRDAYAVESQKRAANAWEKGYFKNSVVPVKDQNGLVILDRDEHMRPGTDMQALASLNPSFQMPGEMGGFEAVGIQAHPEIERINYVHHAGNSSGIVDGAAAVLIGSKAGGEAMGLKPRARIRAFANIGSDPALMLTGPVDVTEKLLKRADMKLSDIDLFELNEAFAAVVLRYCQAFDIPHDKINVNGGAIAMGHPLGATGAMILGTVLDELERRDLNTALVTLCIGAGMGTATIIERV